MSAYQENRITILKDQFAKATKVLSFSDLGKEGQLNKSAVDVNDRFVGIQSAMINQLTVLTQTSLDQVEVSLETIRHLEFFGTEVFKTDDALQMERENAGKIMESFVRAASHNLMGSGELYKGHCQHIVGTEDYPVGPEMLNTINVMERNIDKAAVRFYDIQAEMQFLFSRNDGKHTLFDEDQEPSIRGKSPHIALRELCQKTIANTERSITQNIDHATSLLSRMQLIQSRVMPVLPHLNDEWKQEMFETYLKAEKVIEAIDTLSEIRQERFDFLSLQIV